MTKIDVATGQAQLRGTSIALDQYSRSWIEAVRDERMGAFPSGTLPDGVYDRSADFTRSFEPGELVIQGA